MSTLLEIWKQGPFFPDLGKKIIELPYTVNAGPSDGQVTIVNHTVSPDANGNFLDRNYTEEEQDAIHTYAIVRMVIDLYENLLGHEINWPSSKDNENGRLRVLINGDGTDARYQYEDHTIILEKHGSPGSQIHLCRTVDFVIHETAHAILHSLRPAWRFGNPEAQGITEAFCDLSAMFWILMQKDMCQVLLGETDGDLKRSSMLSLFGVGHGWEDAPFRAIRDAIIAPNESAGYNDVYYYCEYIVNRFYVALVKEFHKRPPDEDPGEWLHYLGSRWIHAIFNAFQGLPDQNPSIVRWLTPFQEYMSCKDNKVQTKSRQ